MLTSEQIQLEHNKLVASLNFHIQNEKLRTEAVAFISGIIKNRLLTAPASSALSKHHAYAGGLLQHINENIQSGLIFLSDIFTFSGMKVSKQPYEDLVLTALIHDIHKIGDPMGRLYYEPNMVKASRKKDETQMVQSTAKPYAVNDNAYKAAASIKEDGWTKAWATMMDRNLDTIPQGELSLMFVQAIQPSLYTFLNDEVKFSVRYHDGAYQSGAKFQLAGKESPVMLAHHFADMISSRRPKWLAPIVEVSEE